MKAQTIKGMAAVAIGGAGGFLIAKKELSINSTNHLVIASLIGAGLALLAVGVEDHSSKINQLTSGASSKAEGEQSMAEGEMSNASGKKRNAHSLKITHKHKVLRRGNHKKLSFKPTGEKEAFDVPSDTVVPADDTSTSVEKQ